jgi:hypothetical protein
MSFLVFFYTLHKEERRDPLTDLPFFQSDRTPLERHSIASPASRMERSISMIIVMPVSMMGFSLDRCITRLIGMLL